MNTTGYFTGLHSKTSFEIFPHRFMREIYGRDSLTSYPRLNAMRKSMTSDEDEVSRKVPGQRFKS